MSAELFARVVELVPNVKRVSRLAGKDVVIGCSPILEKASVPSVEEIKKTVMELLK